MTAVELLERRIMNTTTNVYGQMVFYHEEFKLWLDEAKAMEKEQNNAKIQKAIEKFQEAKSKSSSLKDIVYLDGVLAVLDTIKNETLKSE